MTVLQELAALYDRRADSAGWPCPGFSTENIGAVVVLREDGSVVEIRSLMAPDAKGKPQPRRMSVPTAVKKASGIKPNTLWDKTAYVFGVTMTEDGPGPGRRTEQEHAAFRSFHEALLENAVEPALIALGRFCQCWRPADFAGFEDAVAIVDQNVVFRLGNGPFLHELAAARALVSSGADGDDICLVSGRKGAVARLHPSIKGVAGAQSSGASLVSFNDAAYESHGKRQGDNAPVSIAAASAYTTALNALLAKGSGNVARIGGDTVAFWASGGGAPAEAAAENIFAAAIAAEVQGEGAADRQLRPRIEAVAQGKRPPDDPLDPDTRFFVLGLAPNAARLSVRYWFPGRLGDFARAVSRFWDECEVAPSPFQKGGVPTLPKPWALLYDLAAQRDAKNIPHGLGGDLMRAILSGGRYPATLLAALIGRIRVEGEPDRARHGNLDGRRAAMLRAVLIRNHEWETPMALDETAEDVAYLLGRLFGAYVYAEKSYQDRGAGLRQKYMGAASATPARVFPVLMRGYEHNLASLRKAGGQKAGAGVKADRAVAAVIDRLSDDLPAALPLEAQGRFFIGFYHQISAFYAKAEDAAEALIDDEGEGADE